MAAITKDLLIKKYGETEGILRWDSLILKRKAQHTIEFYIQKYGPDEGVIRFSKKRESDRYKLTLAGYVEKYGETEGRQKWLEKNTKLSVGVNALRKAGKSEEEIVEIRARHKKILIDHFLEWLSYMEKK